MAEILRADIDRLRERLKRDADKYPVLADLLLPGLPNEYDPTHAPIEYLAVPDLHKAELTSTSPAPVDTVQLAAAKVKRSVKVEAVDEARAQFMDEARILNERLKEGRITPLIWNSDMRDLLKDMHTAAFVAGKSGEWDRMTYSDWGRLGQILKGQYAYLRAWAQELYDVENVSLAQLNARAQLYASAASLSLNAAMLSEVGLDPSILPALPGEGSECMVNCRCRWSVRILSKSRGDYDVGWRLGKAEHCRTCRQRAKVNDGWGRLRIRRGQFIDEVPEISFRR